jgi:hypothetical protein
MKKTRQVNDLLIYWTFCLSLLVLPTCVFVCFLIHRLLSFPIIPSLVWSLFS